MPRTKSPRAINGSGKSSNHAVHEIGTFFAVPHSVCNVFPLMTRSWALIPMLASMGMIAWEIQSRTGSKQLMSIGVIRVPGKKTSNIQRRTSNVERKSRRLSTTNSLLFGIVQGARQTRIQLKV